VTAAGNYIRFKKSGSWLFCRLPSGRCIAYVHPKVVMKEVPWKEETSVRCGSAEEAELLYGDDFISYDERHKTALIEVPAKKPTVQYWGINSVNRKWSKQYAYGGLFAENVTQAVARDFMAEGMLRTEAAGYETCLTVHDEIVTYAPEGRGDVAEFEGLMAALPEWGAGCPVAAEGWSGKRYRK
jgi:DNA polymerase